MSTSRRTRLIPARRATLRSLSAADALIVYLTGRDETMRPGTEAALARNGLPAANGSDVLLIMKPDRSQRDDEFKDIVLREIPSRGSVIAIYEYIKDGRLRTKRFGGKYQITQDSVEQYFED